MSVQNAAYRQSSKPAEFQTPFGDWTLRFIALTYLAVMIAVPILVIVINGFSGGLDAFWKAITGKQAISAIWLSVWTSVMMAVINVIMGTLTAYVLTFYQFPGKRVLNAIIDLPFAVPTLVTGVMLVLLYGPQTVIGILFQNTFGSRIIFATPGIVLALLFIGYPFVTRSVQPVLAALDIHQQEAAHTLGAGGWTTFRRIILPAILPAMITGGILSFGRALGEYGSVVLVAGNIPLRTQTATIYVYAQIEGGNPAAASSVSLVILAIALATTLLADRLMRRYGRV